MSDLDSAVHTHMAEFTFLHIHEHDVTKHIDDAIRNEMDSVDD